MMGIRGAAVQCPTDVQGRAEFFATKEDWLAARRQGIGGSEVAVALGLSPWKSPYTLWAEKCGEVEATYDENLNTRCGTLLEPVVRRLWNDEHPAAQVFTHPHWFVRHATLPFLYASPDWLYEDEADGTIGVGEAKTSGRFGAADEWVGGPPLVYAVQGQQLLLVTGRPVVTFVRLVPGRHGWDCQSVETRAHEAAHAVLVKKLSEFWRLVETRTPPPVDAHETTRKTIHTRIRYRPLQEQDMKAWKVLPPQAADIHARLVKAKEDRALAESREDQAHNELIELLGDARFGLIEGVGRYCHTRTEMKERTQVVKASVRWGLTFSDKVKERPWVDDPLGLEEDGGSSTP